MISKFIIYNGGNSGRFRSAQVAGNSIRLFMGECFPYSIVSIHFKNVPISNIKGITEKVLFRIKIDQKFSSRRIALFSSTFSGVSGYNFQKTNVPMKTSKAGIIPISNLIPFRTRSISPPVVRTLASNAA